MSDNSRKRYILGASALLGATLLAQTASATQLTVSAEVPDACTVDTGTLDFGTYPPDQGGDLVKPGSFTVTCSLVSNVDVLFNEGQNYNAGTGRRQMSDGSGNFLEYRIFDDPITTELGNNGSHPQPPLANKPVVVGSNPFTINGNATGGQQPTGGSYSDIVTLSLAFN